MEVHFTPEQDAKISQMADDAGIATDHIARFRSAVQRGIAEADGGDLIDDDDVRLWLEQQERS